jgi:cobalt-zinc-cadmium efflux system outer membrane protein
MRPVFVMAAVAALASAPVQAAPMTYAAALQIASANAPSLAAKAKAVRAAQLSSAAAGRLPDPKVRLGLDNFPVSGPPAGRFGPDSMTMASIGVSQDMPNGAKLQASRARAAAGIATAEAGEAMETRDVKVATGLAWTDLYFAERRLQALGQAEGVINRMIASAPAQVASGAARPGQTVEPDQLMAALGDRKADLTADVAKARAELARWTGDDQASTAGEPPDLEVNAAALTAALDRHPSLLALDAQIRQARADLDQAKADKRPDWGWDVAYQHRDPRWGEMVSAGVTFSLPLFAKTRQDPVIAGWEETVASVRDQKAAMRRELEAELKADLADHSMHHDRLHRADDALTPLAERRAELETSSYAAGAATLADALAAQLALAEARIDRVSRQADVVRDAIRINLTYGADQP